jgi:NmrA-like family
MFGLFMNKPCIFSKGLPYNTSKMSSSKLIVVVGATGNQGSSVVKTFLKLPGWRVRGVTRDVRSSAARDLSAEGVEMVAANLDDPSSLLSAFANATVIFGVTDFWHPFADPANYAKLAPGQTINEWCYAYELQQAKNIFDVASKISTLERLIWSSLSSVKKWSKGKYTWVYHFDSKADAAEYGRTAYPDLWKRTSIIQVGFYLSNFLINALTQPRRVEAGIYEVTSNAASETKWPVIATEEDTGPFVKALLDVPAGKNLIAYRAWMDLDEFTAILSKVTGLRVRYREVTTEEMMAPLPPVVAREGAETSAYVSEFGYEGRDDETVVHLKDVSCLEANPKSFMKLTR